MNTTFTTYAEKKAKQILNLLQGCTKGIRMTAILILLLMGVSNAWGATQRYIYVGISNHYQEYKDGNKFGLNVWGGTDGGVKSLTWIQDGYNWDGRDYTIYRAQVNDDNNKAQFKGNDNWWEPGSGFSVKLNGTTNNAIFFSHNNDGWSGQFQQNYQVTSSASLAASKTSVLVGDNVTLTPSLSSNATYNTIKSTSYTISPNTGASISNNTFKATKAGTYTVTATVTYNAKDFTGITKTASATQTIKVYDTQYVLRGSQTANGDPKGGMAGWDATNNNAYTSATIDGNTMTIVATLTNAKTQYKFMIYNNFDGSYYGQTGSSEIPNNTSWTLNGSYDVKFTTTAAGPYTFIYNTSNKSIKVQYPTAYTVTFSRTPTAAADAPTSSISSGAYVLANTSLTFTAKTAKTGYTWKGWYSNNSGTGDALSTNLAYTRSITANTTIYAVYTANTYTIKFDANGGSGNMSNQNFTYGTAQNLTANNFTRTGYTFAGWATSANGNKVYNDKQSVSNLSSTNGATVTLYAKWTPINYTITYNTNGGSGTMTPTSYTIETATFDLPTPTKTGYTFAGWYTKNDFSDAEVTQIVKGTTGNKILYAKWTEKPKYTVTISSDGNGTVTPNTPQQVGEIPVSITATANDGYKFKNWTKTGNVTIANANSATTTITATGTGTVTANFEQVRRIYLKPAGDNKWADGNARFAMYVIDDEKWYNMTKMDDGDSDAGNDIYYCDIQPTNEKIIFCRMNPSGGNNWDNGNVWTQTDDLTLENKCNLFDIDAEDMGQEYPSVKTGKWMQYNAWHLTGDFNDWELCGQTFDPQNDGSFTFTQHLDPGIYEFKLVHNGEWYGNNGTMTLDNSTGWTMSNANNCKINVTIAGDYIFTINLSNKVVLSVKYPIADGDYRVIYKDNATWSDPSTEHSSNWYHPSRIIKKNNTDEATKDFVSFFISKEDSPKLILQNCTITDGTPEWNNVQDDIRIPAEITESGVYNFVLNQTEQGRTITVEYAGPYTGNYYIRCNAMDGKWSNYKTNSDNRMFYSAFSESEANSFGEKYSHYATKYCKGGTDIKFTIANDYSYCISDTLKFDIKYSNGTVQNNPFGNTENDGVLKSGDDYNANIRFMWNRKTNKISRAYIGAASESNFLVLQGNKNLNNTAKSIKFSDTQNWIYELNVKVTPDTRAKLYACYPRDKQVNEAQYFRGVYDTKAEANWDNNNSAILLGGSGNTSYDMRVLYDFKTNRLMAGLVPSETINGEFAVHADVMIVREHQTGATCITLANDDSKLSNVKTVYGILRFNRLIINNRKDANNELPENEKKTIYERALYFISFPFDVHLSDVFGFGTYGTHWVISEYNGKRRAERGYFADNCVNEDCTNWDYIWRPDTFTMKANTGYLLSLDLDLMQYDNTDFWKHNIEYVELFFPSETTLSTIQQTDYTMPRLGEEYKCTINYGDLPGHTPEESDRRVKDSYWRCIGVPSFANYDGSLYDTTTDPEKKYPIEWKADGETFPFLYLWDVSDNSLIVENTSNYTFQSTFAYLVQNGNEIHWSAVNAKPSSPIVARQRSGEQESNYEWKITLTRGEVQEDQAFVRMTNHEEVTAEFDFGQDLSKELNYGRSDIYTLIGYERAAANSMPLSNLTTTVPLGLDIEQAGDYTIAMPEGMESIGVTLLDAETGERTNLSAGMDYTISLNKGVCHNRLYLEISPIQHTPTDIEYTDQSTRKQSVRKVLIDGQLYIVREGVVYDAQGHRL